MSLANPEDTVYRKRITDKSGKNGVNENSTAYSVVSIQAV